MPTKNAPLNRKLPHGPRCGGQGSFIGRAPSATAAVLDRPRRLVAALSSDPAKAKASAPDYDIADERAYAGFKQMAEEEAKRPDKVDFVSVATPNHTHFEVARTFVEAGFNVICDKPMTFDLVQAEELMKIVERRRGGVRRHAQRSRGYPLVRQAPREYDLLSGELGEINAVRSNYIQGRLRTRLESSDQKQAKWRTDPKRSGAAGAFGDIATRAWNNLARFMTGLLPRQISCLLKTFEEGRASTTTGSANIRFENGALGTVTASQISHGRENRPCSSRFDGTKAATRAGTRRSRTSLIVRQNGQPHRVYTRDGGAVPAQAAGASSRLPSGHPEAFFEAFANVYTATDDAIVKKADGETVEAVNTVYPNAFDGVEGDAVHPAVREQQQGGREVAALPPPRGRRK
jgi:predicted dehydrogenase